MGGITISSMKQVNSIEELQYILLNIAKEFDRICRSHDIPYYMIGGTMLGAIRHKGFIPWDDDMDFGVPYENYNELITILEKELSEPYRCSTYKNSKCVFFPFFKIEDTSTILDDKSLPVPFKQKPGVNIDIFPLIRCNYEIASYPEIKKLSSRCGSLYTDSRTHRIVNLCKKLIRPFWPTSRETYVSSAFNLYDNIEDGPCMGNIGGRWKEKEIVPIEWYGNVYFDFCDTKFRGIKEFDLYLKQMYGDYMKLPPREKQFVHSEKVYIK